MEEAKPDMICHADHDLVGWKDFPKGLRVLLLAEDITSSADLKSRLEQMDYTVSLFKDEQEALKAVINKAEGFHVAIIEVTACNRLGCFRFLETARGLPTIMVSEAQCISTVMKCIALGAAEFLQKPVSEDKLKNIWQHAVHKAFNAGSAVLSRSLKPIKETVASILHLQQDSGVLELNDQESSTMADAVGVDGPDEQEGSRPNERFPAPSTPQLEQSGCRSPDDGDCEDYRINCSIDESKDQVGDPIVEQTRSCASESKSVDDASDNSAGDIRKEEPSTPAADFSREDEIDSACASKTDECAPSGEHLASSPHLDHEDGTIMQNGEDLNQKCSSSSYLGGGGRSNRKRMKVDWTPDLHKRFVQAVEQLGIDQAIPSKILELMKAEGLTRHNVASHLQKYRMRKRHMLHKDVDERRWHQQYGSNSSAGHVHHAQEPRAHYYPYKHFVPLPPPPPPPPQYSRLLVPPPAGQVCHVWGHPSSSYHHHHGGGGGVQIGWGANAAYSPWLQPSGEYWPWKTYPRMHADAWGCPVASPQNNAYPAAPQYCPPQNRGFDVPAGHHRNGASKDAYDLPPAEEVIDEVVREALSKPWLPLPLGLKPPSTESVLTELHRLGVHSVPPR